MTGYSKAHLGRRDGNSPLQRIRETVTWTEVFTTNEDTGEEMLTEEGYGYLLDYLSCCSKGGTMTYEEWQRSMSQENDQPVSLVPVEPYQAELSPVPDAHETINNLKSQLMIMADEVGVQNKQFGAELAHRMFTPLAESFTTTSEEILKRSFGGNKSA
ncbi:hypothetical protein L8106_20885 [Lyngbya sp. PCC 8106]|nr:hypothetical protein L8106_20885 [Lyngbya sp. PCC 8106]